MNLFSQARLVLSALVLLLIDVACKPGDQVTVSGAVAQPGQVAYQAGNSAEAYIKATGGMTDEAVVDEAYLVRGVPDSANAELIRSVTITHEVSHFSMFAQR